MTPIAIISGLSAAANDRLISVSVVDNAGIESDTASIKLDDRDYKLEWPSKGLEITIQLGYKETGTVNMGIFEIDKITYSDAANTMSISARALMTHNNEIKKPHTREWHEKTIGEMVGTIAKDNGFTAEVDPEVAGIKYSHLDQTEESDINFVSRLAETHDCYAKLQDKKLLFKPREQVLGSVKASRDHYLNAGSGIIATALSGVSIDSRSKFKGVKTYWEDRDSKKRTYETVGTEPFYEERGALMSQDKAKLRAAAKLKQLLRGTGKIGSLSMPGSSDIRAEMNLNLEDFRPEVCQLSPWIITKATHTFDNSGYKTTVSAEVKAVEVKKTSKK
ncbi:contractile injection system protein, VgrG/Pvc8 family [Candidatus Albibeggiatoa sp. nov. NOAA]|uniref:phage late control D family protein n=1 Tax=Candidatus Albibeggiatoa sp. nov. NOAA TaxID=3162724 RepID=UPI0032FEB1B5|nr:contractile injection system protein, VgrG/Pvc8 family [Thiotrichaceae bacterium]